MCSFELIVKCVSKNLKEDTREFFGIKKEIKVIPNFKDIDKYAKKHDLCQGNMLAQDDEKNYCSC